MSTADRWRVLTAVIFLIAGVLTLIDGDWTDGWQWIAIGAVALPRTD